MTFWGMAWAKGTCEARLREVVSGARIILHPTRNFARLPPSLGQSAKMSGQSSLLHGIVFAAASIVAARTSLGVVTLGMIDALLGEFLNLK